MNPAVDVDVDTPGGQRRHPERWRSPGTFARLWTAESMPHEWGHAPGSGECPDYMATPSDRSRHIATGPLTGRDSVIFRDRSRYIAADPLTERYSVIFRDRSRHIAAAPLTFATGLATGHSKSAQGLVGYQMYAGTVESLPHKWGHAREIEE